MSTKLRVLVNFNTMYRKLGNITQNGDEISLQYDSSQNSKDHRCHTQHKVITVIKYVANKNIT
jgi:hypothetical protein